MARSGSNLIKPVIMMTFFFIALLFVSSLSEARRLRLEESSIDKGIEIFLEGLYLEGIKTGGPSSGGGGHSFGNAQTLGGIKNSGPSTGGGGH